MLQNGVTALHWAAHMGHTEVAKVLLEQGADINMRNNVSRDGGERGRGRGVRGATEGEGEVCLFAGVLIDIDSLVEI